MSVYVFPRTYAEAQDMLKKDAVLQFSGRAEKRDDGSTTFAVRDVIQPDLKAAQRKAVRQAERIANGEEAAPARIKVVEPTVSAGHLDDGTTTPIVVTVDESMLTAQRLTQFKQVLEEYQGQRPIHMKVRLSDGTEKTLALGGEYKVVGTSAFASEVRALFGGDAV